MEADYSKRQRAFTDFIYISKYDTKAVKEAKRKLNELYKQLKKKCQ